MIRHRARLYLLLLPALIMALALVSSLLLGLFFSLTEVRLSSLGEYQLLGLQNYREILLDELFWSSLFLTLAYAIVAVTAQMILGFNGAYYLYTFQLGWIRPILMAPLLIPPVIAAIMWRFLLRLDPHTLIYYLLSLLGFSPISPFEHPLLLLPSLILIDIWIYTPFVILLLYRGISSIPKEALECSRLEGALELQCIIYTILPSIKSYLLVASTFRFVDSLQQFDSIYGAIGGAPTTIALPLHPMVFFQAFHNGRVGQALGYLSILSLFSLLSLLWLKMLIGRWS